MRKPILLAFIALVLAAPVAAQATEGDATFFCYWIDTVHKQAATTALFRAPVEQETAIGALFAKAMQTQSKAKGRLYDCGYRRDPVQAEQDRQSIRGAYATKSFEVLDVDWHPSDD